MFHKIKLVKKEFEHIKNLSVTIEMVVYGLALVLAVFATASLLEKLGLFSMVVTAIITAGVLIPVAFYLMPNFKDETLPPAITDPDTGSVSVGNSVVTTEDIKEAWVVMYTNGKQSWKVYRIKGKANVSIDTRAFPEADRLETTLQKMFPKTKLRIVQARSPFTLISWVAFLYIAIVAVVGAVL